MTHLFETKRLIIRELSLSDHQEWLRAFKSLKPRVNIFDEPFSNLAECEEEGFRNLVTHFSRNAEEDKTYQFFAFLKEGKKLVGTSQCSLVQRFDIQRAFLGYSVLNNYWRNGYGYEIAKGTIEYAFQSLNLHRLEAEIHPENEASIKLSLKLGMCFEGVRRKCLLVDGVWQDQNVYSILEEDLGISPHKLDS